MTVWRSRLWSLGEAAGSEWRRKEKEDDKHTEKEMKIHTERERDEDTERKR